MTEQSVVFLQMFIVSPLFLANEIKVALNFLGLGHEDALLLDEEGQSWQNRGLALLAEFGVLDDVFQWHARLFGALDEGNPVQIRLGKFAVIILQTLRF